MGRFGKMGTFYMSTLTFYVQTFFHNFNCKKCFWMSLESFEIYFNFSHHHHTFIESVKKRSKLVKMPTLIPTFFGTICRFMVYLTYQSVLNVHKISIMHQTNSQITYMHL
jgi:hypothetical protein